MSQHVDARGAEPHEEARLVERDDGPLGLVQGEQSDARPEQDDRREHEHGRDDDTQRQVRRTA